MRKNNKADELQILMILLGRKKKLQKVRLVLVNGIYGGVCCSDTYCPFLC